MQINPYLMFNGQCEAAFRYYEKHLGGRIVAMMKYSEAPPMPAGEAPPEGGCAPDMTGAENLIMHACMELGNVSLMASDYPPNMSEKMQGMSVTLNVTSVPEAERIFAALSNGGAITSPLQKTFWAAAFGTVTDQFGTPWMVNCVAEAQMMKAAS
ncbi:MAG: VOC family protein [Ferrovibrio sp.]|uniref:VOC family protein n=1 Tax=Ferrovibrio sp. TaxID=1917215 RepID=UPI00260F3585|nr:VOC family protein [Ferrovibrio sp.]MCW0235374.1 VOC family protein [Ferrovibrio sp.]